MENIELSAQAFHIKEKTGESPLEIIDRLNRTCDATQKGLILISQNSGKYLSLKDKELLVSLIEMNRMAVLTNNRLK